VKLIFVKRYDFGIVGVYGRDHLRTGLP